MNRLRTRAAHACLALGLLVWVVSSWANGLHEYLVLHAVCAEHGETIELAAGDHDPADSASAHEDERQASIRAAHDEDDHDHGCASLLASWQGLPPAPALPPIAFVKPHRSPTIWAHAAPRGPPLAWAPKTSPPRAS